MQDKMRSDASRMLQIRRTMRRIEGWWKREEEEEKRGEERENEVLKAGEGSRGRQGSVPNWERTSPNRKEAWRQDGRCNTRSNHVIYAWRRNGRLLEDRV